jgi:hypothetical protein
MLMLDDPTLAAAYGLIMIAALNVPVCWIFQRIERKYGYRPREVVRFWFEEVEAYGFWLMPLLLGFAGVMLFRTWLYMAIGPLLLLYVGMAMVSNRLRTNAIPQQRMKLLERYR